MENTNPVKSEVQLMGEGDCKCIKAPMGNHGLEGYSEGELYRFQRMNDHAGEYYRVFPSFYDAEWGNPEYYETCGAGTFSKYFHIEVEQGKPTEV